MSEMVAESLRKDFPTRSGKLEVLRDISLSLARGQSAVVMGPSGSGKSTLLNILGTLESPSSGTVRIEGANPFGLAEPELARFRNSRIGFVFQDHHLLPQLNVLENVLLPTLAGKTNADATKRARELLDRVGLSGRLDHRPAELSGGERQRVALARAMINRPLLLLCDEPTGNLDRDTAAAVGALLTELHESEKNILIVVTHSTTLAERFGRPFELFDGTLKPL